MDFQFPTPALLERTVLHAHVEALRDYLQSEDAQTLVSPDGGAYAPGLVPALHAALGDALRDPPSRGDYYSHNPIVSLVQSTLDRYPGREALTGEAETDDERMGDPYTAGDVVGWSANIGLSLIHRLLKGSHPFNKAPAEARLEDGARLVLLSDWGTGREGAAAVARQASRYVDGADHRPTHLIHLGDTYYSGTPDEHRHNILEPWPVSPAQALHVPSWALNGNHDMYSGGHGLFEVTLRDPRFERQQAGGAPTSWCTLEGSHWNVLALDTSYRRHLVSLLDGKLELEGQEGTLEEPQEERLAALAADHRRLLVLSHHQLFAAYDDVQPAPLATLLEDTLAKRHVDAWFWGHEHDSLAYTAHGGVTAARSIGNGAVPVLVRDTPATVIDDGPLVVPTPPVGTAEDHPLRAVAWEYRGYRIGGDGGHWMKHGFAVLDFDRDALHVRYIDDEGVVIMEEEI